MNICLINASQPQSDNNDSYVDFRNYSTYEDAKWRSWHSIPCSLKTEFFAYNGQNFHECYKYDGFIILFNEDPHLLIPLVKKLKIMKKKVCVGYHESYDDLMLKASHNFTWLNNAKSLIKEADFYLNVCPSFQNEIQLLFGSYAVNTYHAAPRGVYDDLKMPQDKREGVLVATRTFNQRLRRNTLWSLLEANDYARKNNTFVTLVCEDDPHSMFPVFDCVTIIKGPLKYSEWLKLIAKHKFVYSRDESKTLNQVALDAALVSVPCFGGTGENNKITNSCRDIYSVKYNGNYDYQIDTLLNICSLEGIASNIKKAFMQDDQWKEFSRLLA